MAERIKTKKEYSITMKRIEKLLQKVTAIGGFDKLSKVEAERLKVLSFRAEQYEDKVFDLKNNQKKISCKQKQEEM